MPPRLPAKDAHIRSMERADENRSRIPQATLQRGSEKRKRDGVVKVKNVEPLVVNHLQKFGQESVKLSCRPVGMQPAGMKVVLVILHASMKNQPICGLPADDRRGTREEVYSVATPGQLHRELRGDA